jgi:hypothetical protein
MEPSVIGPLFQYAELIESWQTEDGEMVWLWRDDLALVLTLDMSHRCSCCGQHLAGRDRWSLLRGDVLAREFFGRSYR